MSEAKFTEGPWFFRKEQGFMLGTLSSSLGKIIAIFKRQPKEEDMHLIAAAPEMYEENEARAKLLGKIYVALQQKDSSTALELLNEAETIDFSSGEPVALSPSLAKARGEKK